MVAKGQPLDVSLLIAPFPGALTSGTIVLESATPINTILTAVGVPKGRPKPDISTPDAVKKALLAAKRIGYEDPDFTAAGQGPWEALTRLGIAEQVAGKSEVELGPGSQGIAPNTTRNTIKTAARLANGDIDIGMLMLSDMVPQKDQYDIVGVLPRSISTPVAVVGYGHARGGDPRVWPRRCRPSCRGARPVSRTRVDRRQRGGYDLANARDRRAEDLIQAADLAMYEGKRSGKGTVRVYKAA